MALRSQASLTGPLDLATDGGMRDRAILETLYSTGMRRMELVGLKLFDVDLERGTAMIRQCKGKKDSMIPIGDRALAWIAEYRDVVRPQWALDGCVIEPEPLCDLTDPLDFARRFCFPSHST